jgi:hypothetical protein
MTDEIAVIGQPNPAAVWMLLESVLDWLAQQELAAPLKGEGSTIEAPGSPEDGQV